jgi:hypothetical protein
MILVDRIIKLLRTYVRSMIALGDPKSGPVFRCPFVRATKLASFAAATWQTECLDGIRRQKKCRPVGS